MAKDGGNINIGKRLQQARKSASLDLADIATASNITKSKLDAMERNHFDKVGSDIFVIGYIRKFASIVGIPSDELVDSYKANHTQSPQSFHTTQSNQVVAQEDIIQNTSSSGSSRSDPKNSTTLLWITSILAIILIIGLIMIFVGGEDEGISSSDASPNQVSAPATASTQPAPKATLIPTTAIVDAEPSPLSASSTLPTQIEELNPVAAESDGSINPTLATSPTMPETTAAAASSSINAELTPEPQLRITFSDDCWLRVSDSDGNELFAGVKAGGSQLTLEGKTPISIRLGNAAAASVFFNGVQVDSSAPAGRTTRTLRLQ